MQPTDQASCVAPWLCDAIAELGLNLVSKSTGGLGRFASVGSLVVISGFRGNLGLFAGVSIEALPKLLSKSIGKGSDP